MDDYGVPTDGWATLATVRAQVMQSSTEEFLKKPGTLSETAIIFRVRHLDGLTTSDRVTFGDQAFNIVEIKELGRRSGLELRCTSPGAP